MSNVIGPRFGLKPPQKEDWGECARTGKPHRYYVKKCFCGAQRKD